MDNKNIEDTSSTDNTGSMAKESDASGGIVRQLLTSTFGLQKSGLQGLGAQALSRSWWQRWIYPVLFLLTLTLSLAT